MAEDTPPPNPISKEVTDEICPADEMDTHPADSSASAEKRKLNADESGIENQADEIGGRRLKRVKSDEERTSTPQNGEMAAAALLPPLPEDVQDAIEAEEAAILLTPIAQSSSSPLVEAAVPQDEPVHASVLPVLAQMAAQIEPASEDRMGAGTELPATAVTDAQREPASTIPEAAAVETLSGIEALETALASGPPVVGNFDLESVTEQVVMDQIIENQNLPAEPTASSWSSDETGDKHDLDTVLASSVHSELGAVVPLEAVAPEEVVADLMKNVAPERAVAQVNDVASVEAVAQVNDVASVEAVAQANAVASVETVAPVRAVAQVNAVASVETVAQVNAVASVEAGASVEAVAPILAVAPLEAVAPTVAIASTEVVSPGKVNAPAAVVSTAPAEAAAPLERRQPSDLAEAAVEDNNSEEANNPAAHEQLDETASKLLASGISISLIKKKKDPKAATEADGVTNTEDESSPTRCASADSNAAAKNALEVGPNISVTMVNRSTPTTTMTSGDSTTASSRFTLSLKSQSELMDPRRSSSEAAAAAAKTAHSSGRGGGGGMTTDTLTVSRVVSRSPSQQQQPPPSTKSSSSKSPMLGGHSLMSPPPGRPAGGVASSPPVGLHHARQNGGLRSSSSAAAGGSVSEQLNAVASGIADYMVGSDLNKNIVTAVNLFRQQLHKDKK